MARRKRINPLLKTVQQYLDQNIPELRDARPVLRTLDGPMDAPRYSVTAETCTTTECPYGVLPEVSSIGKCPVRDCALRCSVRLLLDRQGDVVHITRSGIHWSS